MEGKHEIIPRDCKAAPLGRTNAHLGTLLKRKVIF